MVAPVFLKKRFGMVDALHGVKCGGLRCGVVVRGESVDLLHIKNRVALHSTGFSFPRPRRFPRCVLSW